VAKPILLPYQQHFIEDQSPLKMVLKARQIGFSFAMSLEAVLLAIEAPCNVIMLSASQRQSNELMQKVYQHLRALDILVGEAIARPRENAEEVAIAIGGSQSRIICLPANPDTVRGFSGHIFLDEFAFHRDDRAIWRAIYPTVTRGYKLRIASTPNGKQNLFYELWTAGRRFSRHKVDIYEAVAEGLPVDVTALREAIADPDAWAQEYECRFIDEATAFLTYEAIAACEDEKADMAWEPDGENRELYLGVDIGRKRDLTVMWLLERVGDVYWTRMVKALERAPFRAQRDELFALLPHVRRACIDATGLGAQLAEECQTAFGTYRVEAVTFTNTVKESLAIGLRRKFEDRLVRIPAAREIRDDLHSVRKLTTAAGNIRFDAERTDDGHADRFWALALAIQAATTPYARPEYTSVLRRHFRAGGAY